MTSAPTAGHVRLARADDGAALAVIYRPSVVGSATSFELEPPDGAEMAARVVRTLQRHPWLVLEREGRVLGYAYAGAHRERPAYGWSVEVSAYVHADARRLGVASTLYARLLALLARQGFVNAYAGIALPNDASVGLHESLGFARVGVYRGVGFKLGAWHDVLWMERALGPRHAEPAAPRALPALAADEVARVLDGLGGRS